MFLGCEGFGEGREGNGMVGGGGVHSPLSMQERVGIGPGGGPEEQLSRMPTNPGSQEGDQRSPMAGGTWT